MIHLKRIEFAGLHRRGFRLSGNSKLQAVASAAVHFKTRRRMISDKRSEKGE